MDAVTLFAGWRDSFLPSTNILAQWFPECAPANSYQGIRGYNSALATLKFTYFLNYRSSILLKVIEELFLTGDIFISYVL